MLETKYRLYSSLSEVEEQKTRAEINLGALRQNYRFLTGEIKLHRTDVRPIAVVKADAYGHGAPECVRALLAEGCDFFAVSCADEAFAIRTVCEQAGTEADILILGYTSPGLAGLLARNRIIQALLSEEYALALQAAADTAGVTVRTHVALDTGMNRIGFPAHSAEEIASSVNAISSVSRFPNLRIEGMFTHFARADEVPGGDGDRLTALQSRRYRAVADALADKDILIPFHHVCNSAASLRRPQDYFNGVRVGILLYGAPPSEHFQTPLKPVMRLCTVISHIHSLLPGESVSYGGDFAPDSGRLIATLPIGYADGFVRACSGAEVTVHTVDGDRRVRVVGRICMDQCMIDITGTPARCGDTVTLFGNNPHELSALAARASTIPYEVLCLVSSRILRVYREET